MAVSGVTRQSGPEMSMLSPRSSSLIPAIPSTASAEEIAKNVRLWQSRYQPVPASAPPPPSAAPTLDDAPHLKEAAANWFAEARRQDMADENEVRDRVNRVMGRNGILG
jgi:hypothetical protein